MMKRARHRQSTLTWRGGEGRRVGLCAFMPRRLVLFKEAYLSLEIGFCMTISAIILPASHDYIPHLILLPSEALTQLHATPCVGTSLYHSLMHLSRLELPFMPVFTGHTQEQHFQEERFPAHAPRFPSLIDSSPHHTLLADFDSGFPRSLLPRHSSLGLLLGEPQLMGLFIAGFPFNFWESTSLYIVGHSRTTTRQISNTFYNPPAASGL